MLKRKQRVLTPEQMEEIRTKDFFDMILPGTVKIMTDHYIIGDSYRSVSELRKSTRNSRLCCRRWLQIQWMPSMKKKPDG